MVNKSLLKLIYLHILIIFGYCQVYKPYNGDSINVCGSFKGMTVCCEGWAHSLNGACTTAICDGNCGDHGICIKPNQCRCEDKSIRFDCLEDSSYDLLSDEPVSCPNGCNMQGSCINGRCVCEYGYVGDACEKELKSLCFVSIARGVCKNPLTGSSNRTVEMTKSVCCGALGAAWGTSCKVCEGSRCGQGYLYKENLCFDIDECAIPGVCTGGKCQNTEGSFICTCPYRHVYDANNLRCKPIQNICERQSGVCQPGGTCVSLESGSYKCACREGYIPTETQKACVRKIQPINYCEIYKNRICRNGVCLPTGNTYECKCNSGYTPSNDKRECHKNYDICSIFGDKVCKHGNCISMGRKFKCQCERGYRLSQDGYFCLDKCQQLGSPICNNGVCIPRPYGGYECQCNAGYSPSYDKKFCERSLKRYDEVRKSPSMPYIYNYDQHGRKEWTLK